MQTLHLIAFEPSKFVVLNEFTFKTLGLTMNINYEAR